jgi:hypothetical protein
MKIFSYHPEKHYFTGESDARIDPLEAGEFLIPAFATTISPPECGNYEAAIFDGDWIKKIDRIGQHYYQQDGVRVEIEEYGIDIPEGSLTEDPPTEYHDSHDGSVWIENTDLKDQAAILEEIQTIKADLRGVVAWQFKMILELFEVGKAKGVWSNADFSTEVKQKAAEWKIKSDRLIELE